MKKITLLFALLLSIVSGTAVAQTTYYTRGDEITDLSELTEDTKFVFYHNSFGLTLYAPSTTDYIRGKSGSYFDSQALFVAHATTTDGSTTYTFESSDNTGYYIPVINRNSNAKITLSETAEPFTISDYSESGFIITGTNNYGSETQAGAFDYCSSGWFTGWWGSGSNCYYKLYKVQEASLPLVTISNTKVFTASTASRGSLAYDSNISSTGLTSTSYTGFTLTSDDQKQLAFLTSGSNVYLYSVGAGKFVSSNGSGTVLATAPSQTVTLTENYNNSASYPYLIVLNNGSSANQISASLGYTDRAGIITSWNDATDGGNQWLLEEATASEATSTALTAALARIELYEALAAATAPSDMNFGTGYGEYTDAGNYTEAYNNAQTLLSSEDATTEQLTSAKTALSTALGQVALNTPKAGAFLRIKAHNSGTTYLAGENSSAKDGRAAYKTSDDDPTGTVFYYNDGKLYNLSNGYPIANTAASGNAFAGYNGITTGVSIEFGKQTAVTSGDPGLYYVKFAGSRYLYAQDANYSDAGGGMNNVRYTFDLEEVTTLPIQITSAGYATLNLPVAVTVPDGVTVYYLNGEGENSVKIEAQSITTIPANTPVLIAGSEGTHNFAIATEAEAAEDATTGLTGVTIATTIDAATSAYVLANKTTYGVGFYPLSTDNRGLKGFRAYYVPTNSASAGFAFQFGETTAIDAAIAEALSGDAPIYDLSGRKVTKAVKGGLYIQNGKKVIK